MPEHSSRPPEMGRTALPQSEAKPAPVAPTTAEQVLDHMLRDNASALSMLHTRIREAEANLKRERTERDRLSSIREGMQKALEAVRASGGSSVAPISDEALSAMSEPPRDALPRG